MRRAHHLRLAVGLTTVGALLSTLALAPSAQAAPHVPAGWAEVTHGHMSGQDSYLYDAWTTGDEVWTAGVRRAYIGGVFEWRNLVQRCVGASCTATYPIDIESPPNTSNWLRGISGTSTSDVWAVGYARYGSTTRPTLHHWNGSAWSIIPNPVTSGALYGVSAVAPNDVWAVGEDYSSGQKQLVLHWDGSSWTKMAFSLTGGCAPSDYLYDIAADGKRPMVISECRVEGAQPEPLVASYKNGAWKREAVPIAVPDATNLYAVAWVGTHAWVGGGGWTNAVAVRLKKHTWTDKSGTFVGTIFGIEGASTNDLWAVGTGGTSIRLALHWDGHAWTSTDAGSGGGWFETVTVTGSGTPWAAGQKVGQSLISRYDGSPPMSG